MLSILYLRCRSGRVKPSTRGPGTFNSLFEMLVAVNRLAPPFSPFGAFNSLLEMHCQHNRGGHGEDVRLSILYLRCELKTEFARYHVEVLFQFSI